MALAGHEFLASLGKTRLRPGGKEATDFLLQNAEISADTKVLEVACNRGQSMMEIASRFGSSVVGVDKFDYLVKEARENIENLGLTESCSVELADAQDLPFKDECFDVVVNEAMLTMLSRSKREAVLQEYFRVLKPGGYLLTHDVMLLEDDEKLRKSLGKTIKLGVHPETFENWMSYFEGAGFSVQNYKSGEMTLISPKGLLKDEGALNAAKIVRNGMKAENREYFLSMKNFFMANKDKLRYIAVVSRKLK